MSTLVGIVIGLITGVFASMLFWWWQAKILQPKVTICPTLARYKSREGKERCEVKLINSGRRSAADLLVKIHLIVPGLTGHGINQVFVLREERLPWLSPKEDWYYLIDPSQFSDRDRQDYEHFFFDSFGIPLRNLTDVSMRKFLERCEGAVIKVFVAANDSFSGAAAFSKQEFELGDISIGAFLEGDTCSHTGAYEASQASEKDSAYEEL